jgi:fungal STAND N-terminal Goodbye domain
MSGRLQVLFDTALQSYEKQTGMRLIDHPLARQLENCHSVDSIMDILQQQARALTDFRRDDGKAMNSLKRAVYVLHALSSSTTLGEGVGLVRRMASLGPKAIPLISQFLTVTLVS